jgi:Fe(3+) dicitrate transport protein
LRRSINSKGVSAQRPAITKFGKSSEEEVRLMCDTLLRLNLNCIDSKWSPLRTDPEERQMIGVLKQNRAMGWGLALGSLFWFLAGVAVAQSEDLEPSSAVPGDERGESQAAEKVQEMIYDRVTVLGSAESAARIPGSAHTISLEELEKHQNTDIHRILRQIPGVNIQEEDGFGLRPNIGIRGTGVERSQKVTLMEDGVLIAPAPYSAPAAYYSPTAGRMETLEVQKGTAAVRQGPQSNGGVINYVSSAIPGQLSGRLQLTGGDHGMGKLHGLVGGSWDHFGFLVETFQQESSGFKRLDGGGDTGFELSDYLLKARFNSSYDARIYQDLEIKVGRTDQDGNETYLGLTRDDFRRDPYRRYRGSQLDNIDAEHEQVQLRWFVRTSERLDFTTTFYRNDFFRNWYKNESTLGVSNRSVLSDPVLYAEELAVLRGDVDSVDNALLLRNNRRDYYSQGLQTVASFHGDYKKTSHRLEVGLRLHKDEEDRFQEDDLYAIHGGNLILTSSGLPGSQSNRVGQAEALALFVQDEISVGRFTFSPGVRFEQIKTQRLDFGKNDPGRTGVSLARRENEVDVVVPGLGLGFRMEGGWSLFGSAHRGFAPPSPSSNLEVDAEESINYELGARFSRGKHRFEAIAFLNDYSNLLGADTLSGGGTGTGDQFNGGAVDVKGLELSLSTDLLRKSKVGVPVRLAYTFTEATFDNSFVTSFADWAPRVEKGDELPYLPEHQIYAEIGLELERFRAYLSGNYVGDSRTTAGQGAIPAEGKLEDHLVFDLSLQLDLFQHYRLFAQMQNLSDEVYVAAQRPYGLRPGMPRTMLVGFGLRF